MSNSRKLKIVITLMFFGLFHLTINAQVGINTVAPVSGSLLDMQSDSKGILIPRVDIINLNTIDPVTDVITNLSVKGLLVFNTNTTTGEGFYYWNGVDQWVPVGIKERPSFKYVNSTTNQNLNVTTLSKVKIAGTLSWNDDSSVYELVNDTEIKIKVAGRYSIEANLSLEAPAASGLEINVDIQLAINGTLLGPIFSQGYIGGQARNNHDHSSVNFREVLQLQANDVISINSKGEAHTGGSQEVYLRSAGTSNILITKIN